MLGKEEGLPAGMRERTVHGHTHTELSQDSVTVTTVISEKVPCKYHESERHFPVNLHPMDRCSFTVLQAARVPAGFHCNELSET